MAATQIAITAYGQRISGLSVAIGSTVEFTITCQDPFTRDLLDLTGSAVVMALCSLDSQGNPVQPPLIARQGDAVSTSVVRVPWAPRDTVPTNETAFAPGQYGLDIWIEDADGNRTQHLAFAYIDLTPAAFLPDTEVTVLPTQPPLGQGPAGNGASGNLTASSPLTANGANTAQPMSSDITLAVNLSAYETSSHASSTYETQAAAAATYVPLTRTLTAGQGIATIGDLSANRTIALSDDITWTKEVDHTIAVADSTTTNAAGGGITLQTAAGNGTGAGGAFTLQLGAAGGSGPLGPFTGVQGGYLDVFLGNGQYGGDFTVIAGHGTTQGGSATLKAGNGLGNGSGGNYVIDAGAKAGSGANGTLSLGTTNAESVAIGRTGKTTTVAGNLVVNGTATVPGYVPTTRAVSAGSGLSGGGDLSADRTLSIASAGVTNAMLANNSITVTAGTGLTGGGTVALGGSVTLNASGGGTNYQTVDANGSAVTQRPTLNFSSAFTAVDNSGATRTDVGLAAAQTFSTSVTTPQAIASGTAPTVVVSMNGGGTWTNTNGTISVTGRDEVGFVRLVTGTGVSGVSWLVANSPIFTVTLNAGNYPNGFEVICVPRNERAASFLSQFSHDRSWYAQSISATTWGLYPTSGGALFADSTTYDFSFILRGY